MEFLMRSDSKLSDAQWKEMDEKVVSAARSVLTGRKFLNLFGPLGVGLPAVEVQEDGKSKLALFSELSTDFTLSWKSFETAERLNIPMSYTEAVSAAVSTALQEDQLIFFGDEGTGQPGLLSNPGKMAELQDWDKEENAFAAISSGLQFMLENHVYGHKALVVSPDVFAMLQRIQPGTGLLESRRISALLEGEIYQSPVLPAKTVLLVASDEQNMDLAIGQDLVTAYLGTSGMDHDFRVLETVLLRLKNKNAVVAFRS